MERGGEHSADYFLVAIIVLLIVSISVIVAASVKYGGPLSTSASPKLAATDVILQTFPGVIASPGKNDLPVVQLVGSWFLDTQTTFPVGISCKSANLTVANNAPQGRSLFLVGGDLSVGKLCNTFTPKDIKKKAWALVSKNAVVQPGISTTVLGLGPQKDTSTGKYVSPFLKELVKQGFTSWTFTNRLNLMAIYCGVPEGACLSWCWEPFVLPEQSLYIIKLEPTKNEPWTHAVINVGRWMSNFPGWVEDSRPLLLRTSAHCSITVVPESYTTLKNHDLQEGWCELGVSAVAYQSACAFDLGGNRFGLSTVAIGNIVENTKSYSFEK